MTVELTPRGTHGRQMPKPLRLLVGAMTPLSVAVYRLFGERMRIQGLPLLLLTTVGAHSGKTRQTVVACFPDSDDRSDSWLIVASNAGAAVHPGWYFNLARNPDKVSVQVGKRKVKVRPESLTGAERTEAWRRIVSLAPSYGKIPEQTDRQVPVVRLTPESA
jgi:deazaflavin-dependent oxidoreductase (nitroreductase family)